MERFFGCHVSVSGGLVNGIKNGQSLGVNTIQVHPCPPQRWNLKPFEKGVEDEFLIARESSGIKRVFFHGIYLINLANPDPKQFGSSKTSLANDLDLIARVGGDGVIFHVGSLKHNEDEDSAFRQVANGIDEILSNTDTRARLILEVSAGSGKVIGDQLEELAAIYYYVQSKERVGFGLDTQHLWASGYDIKGDTEGVVAEIIQNFTAEKIWAIHLNDSKSDLGSKIDRHENLGEGKIGWDALKAFINHPQLRDIPVILETPGLKEMTTAQNEVNQLQKMLLG